MALPIAVLKLAWKFLGPAVTALVLKLGDEGFQALKLMLKTRQGDRRAQAEARAQAAQRLAQQARVPGEAERYAAQADVWREVANQYAQDNKALAEELDSLKQQMANKSVASVQALGAPDSRSRSTPGVPRQGAKPDIDKNK